MLFISALLLTVLVVGYVLCSWLALYVAPFAIGLALALLAVWVSVGDARTRTISNVSCIAVAVLGLGFQGLRLLAPVAPLLPGPLWCVLCASGLTFVLAAAEFFMRDHLGKRGLGFGDVKYIGAWALALGPAAVFALAFGCLVASVWALARKQRTFAFAPFLSVGFVLGYIAVCILS